MSHRSRLMKALFLAPVAALILASATHRPAAARTEYCPLNCGVKVEHGPWEYCGDRVIVAVCIKAGTKTFAFNGNGTNGCYTVTGLGTTHVTVTGGGTSRTCKDISHVVFYYDCNSGDDAPSSM